MKLKLFFVFIASIFYLNSFTQNTFGSKISIDNVFLPIYYTNKNNSKVKIASNYKILGKVEGNRLIIYLTITNSNQYIEGKRGAYYILFPKSLSVNESKISLTFLDKNKKAIESAYIKNFEDIVYKLVKKLPGTRDIAGQVEDIAKKLDIGKLENENMRKTLLTPNDFSGLGMGWDSQYNEGHWISANYIRIVLPFYNSSKEVENEINNHGIGTFFYFQSSVINSPCGVYAEFKLNDSDTFTDPRDGQTYTTIEIGSQTWFAENLNYETSNSWWYDNSSANGDIYGRLYTWDAALNACPTGWHLPSDEEWTILSVFLGGANIAGYKMKAAGTAHWNSPNTGATKSSGFTALLGGNRSSNGSFDDSLGYYGSWWSSTETSGTDAWRRGLDCDYGLVHRSRRLKTNGFSVRCLKN